MNRPAKRGQDACLTDQGASSGEVQRTIRMLVGHDFRRGLDRRVLVCNTCMMTQVSQQQPGTPRQAARKRAPVDRLLDTELFKALSDPTRARLLACLVKCGRPCSVTELSECCSVDFSVVARHLAALARAGAIEGDKRGRIVWYTARCSHLCERLRSLADAIADWCPCMGGSESQACSSRRCGGGDES